MLLGIRDVLQRRHSIPRNFPVLGHMRFLLERIRPEIQQYFIERNYDGRPYDRESVVCVNAMRERHLRRPCEPHV